MNEFQKMANEIRNITITMTFLSVVTSLFLFPNEGKAIVSGIIVGGCTGIMGFNMICRMCAHVDGDSIDVKNRAFRSYSRRYGMYALIFAVSISAGVNILALLIGMLAHKISILIYTMRHRKEDD